MNMGCVEHAKCDIAGFVVAILCDGDSDAVAELMDRACGYNESSPRPRLLTGIKSAPNPTIPMALQR